MANGLERQNENHPRAGDEAAQATNWPDIAVREAILATVTVLGIAFTFWLVWRFRIVAIAAIGAIFLHIAVKPLVESLFRRGVARRVGIVLVYVVLVTLSLALVVAIVPMLAAQAGALVQELPDYYRLIRNFMLQSDVEMLLRLGRLLPPAWDAPGLQAVLATGLSNAAQEVVSPWDQIGAVGRDIFFVIAVFAMTLYLTLDRERILHNGLLRLPISMRDEARGLVEEIELKVGAFLRGQFVLCTVVGILSFAAYLIIGLPYAFALGALAFLFEAVPMVGPLLAALAAGIVAATIGPDKVLWVLVASFVIQLSENNILVPRIMGKAVGVNAIVTILSITAFTVLFGLVGALLAIPLAAILQVLIDRRLFAVSATPAAFENPAPGQGNPGGTRTARDVVRVEAADLAQDVRKQVRSAGREVAPEVEGIEDQIELAALEIARILAGEVPARSDTSEVAAAAASGR